MARLGAARLGATRLGEPVSDLVSDHWRLNGLPIATVVEERRTPRELALTVQCDRETRDRVLQPLEENAGAVEIVDHADGGYRARDLSGGDNTHHLRPPDNRQAVRTLGTVLVSEYEDEPLDQRGDRYEVEVSFVPAENISADLIGALVVPSGGTHTIESGTSETYTSVTIESGGTLVQEPDSILHIIGT